MREKSVLRILLTIMVLAQIGFSAAWIYVFKTQVQCDDLNMTGEMINRLKLRGQIRNVCEAVLYVSYIVYCWWARYVYQINDIKVFVQLMQKLVIIGGIVSLLAIGMNYIIVSQILGVLNFLEPMLVCIGISIVNLIVFIVMNKRKKIKF